MKKLSHYIFIFLFSLCFLDTALAQSASGDEQKIKTKIGILFDGMRNNDGAAVRSVFAPDAMMRSVVKSENGEVSVREGDLQAFIAAVDRDKDERWDERIHEINIQMDGGLASAFTPYSFYRGEEFSHCGANSMQFVKLNGEWVIYFIIDTRRTTGCEE